MEKHRVLVADNIKMIHTLVRAHLEGEPVEIHSAYDGQQALEMASALLPSTMIPSPCAARIWSSVRVSGPPAADGSVSSPASCR